MRLRKLGENITAWGHEIVSDSKCFAPIVLFVYNRLDHTKRTVEALQKNMYATQSALFIYSDAPKNEDAVTKVQEVREYIKNVDGFTAVTIIERDQNLGLARSIIDGVTHIVNQYGKIIVLEDDIVTTEYFLKYMNDALNIYDAEKKVMQIAGYMYPIEYEDLPETFFLRAPDCWGWATWKDRWKYFERDPVKLVKEFSEEDIYRFNFDGSCDFWSQVQANLSGKIYTWAIFWCASVFRRDGLALYPRQSLVQNIGCDNTGVHCDDTNCYSVILNNNVVEYFPKLIKENEKSLFRIQMFFRKNNSISLLNKIFNRVKRLRCKKK